MLKHPNGEKEGSLEIISEEPVLILKTIFAQLQIKCVQSFIIPYKRWQTIFGKIDNELWV